MREYSSRSYFTNLGSITILLALVTVFSLLSPNFLSVKTFTAIANQIPGLTVLAIGMTFVIIIGGIDLSVGSIMAFSAVGFASALVEWQWPIAIAILLAFGLGTLCGSINGLIISHWKIPSFIVTLAMLEMARGATYLLAQSRTIYIGSEISWINDPLIGGISLAFVLALCLVFGAHMILTETVFGRYVVGIGTNETAMQLSGINSAFIRVVVFTGAGGLASVAALLSSSRLEAADPNAGIGLELQVIASVVIGGTSLLGGRGSVIATFVGVLIISTLETGLSQIGTSEPFKRIITGLVIMVAVILDIHRSHLQKKDVIPSDMKYS